MGSKQFGLDLSAWSLRPGVSLALGGVLVVVIIMAASAIFLLCYYWTLLVRKAMAPATALLPPPASSTPAPAAVLYPLSDYTILMKLPPPRACPPSTVVLMPGEDMPTFLAMPCNSSWSVETKKHELEQNEQSAKPEGAEAEVKLEVYMV